MRTIAVVVLLLVAAAQCQIKPTTKTVHKPTVAERLDKLEAYLQETAHSRDDLKADNERLKAANKELSDSNIALAAKYEELRKSAAEVLAFGTKAAAEYENAVSANSQLAEKYNALLNQANYSIAQANARLSRQAQISNALAIYSIMPKYTQAPIPTPVMPQALNLQTTCTSSNIGNTTYTNCH